jgi:hypothetical protein
MVMVGVFVGFRILLRFLVERLLATGGAKIVCLPFVFGTASGGLGINIHAANRVFGVHIFSFLLNNDQ